ncbi:hypothetical protein [Paenibacillus caui]|uniref:hypothetical protein n=1 Tax=Paenibacillus caui TaxID=2873927 RepID=UPI001CA899DD|nr:hypothetical protein [Paenibacillus caui]
MARLINEAQMSALLKRKSSLYKELLVCSELQRELVLKGDAEDIGGRFPPLASQWNRLTMEIEALQQQINDFPADSIAADESLTSVMNEILSNIEVAQNKLRDMSSNTGTGLQHVKNHQKVMNAYYNLQNRDRDQIPLYVDEKK